MKQKMLFYDHGWPESFDTCPCDQHFTDWLAAANMRGKTIFHFGTGAHHRVGLVAQWLGNSTIGITASQAEMDAYEALMIEHPEWLHRYQVMFGDIYTINPALLPDLDIVTLFHLCEFTDERRAEYGGCTDREVCLRLLSRLRPGGWLVAYPGSMAWVRAQPILSDLVTEGRLTEPAPWRSLAVYRRGEV